MGKFSHLYVLASAILVKAQGLALGDDLADLALADLDDSCPPGYSKDQVYVGTHHIVYPVLVNSYFQANTIININGDGNQITISNAPTNFSSIFTVTTTSTVTSTANQTSSITSSNGASLFLSGSSTTLASRTSPSR